MCLLLVVSATGCGGTAAESDSAAAAPAAVARAEDLKLDDAPVDLDALVDPVALPKTAESAGTPEGETGATPNEEPADDPDSPFRKWRDPAGKVLAVGELVSLLDGNVCLQTEEGLGAVVALDALGPDDQQFVRDLLGEPVEVAAARDPADHPSGPVQDQTRVAQGAAGQTVGSPSQPEDYSRSGRKKVVIPFDFESKFDDGRYGSMVGDMFWKKIEREGGFVVPESMYDVRDLCKANGVAIGPQTPLEEVKKAVVEHFAADIAVWGSVERVAGHEWDVYDLVIKCADFTAESEPKMIYEVAARTNVVSEIPHLYGQQLLDKLYDRQPGGPRQPDPIAEENWQKNPNLVVGDFQTGASGVPKGWAPVGGQHREPLGKQVSWIAETGNTYNKVIRLTFDEGIGNSYGVMYYSDWFPVDEGATYRFQCRYRTNGPAVKVFIKCYDEMASEYRGGSPGSAGAPSDYHPGSGGYVPDEMQRREVYRSQQNLKGPKNVWNTQTEDFTPRHTKYVPRWGRVMLYGYLGGGVVEFDDVVVKQIIPASPGESKKDPRHSMESTVTIEQMRENEQRGREAAERARQGEN